MYELIHRDRIRRKFSDRHDRSVHSHRLEDDIDPGSVLQPGIHDRRSLIDISVRLPDDLLDHIAKAGF